MGSEAHIQAVQKSVGMLGYYAVHLSGINSLLSFKQQLDTVRENFEALVQAKGYERHIEEVRKDLLGE